jgi:hypothetical protein
LRSEADYIELVKSFRSYEVAAEQENRDEGDPSLEG